MKLHLDKLKPYTNYLWFGLFLAIGVYSVYSISTKINLNSIWETLLLADKQFLLLVFLSGLFGYVARAYRWQLLIDSTQEKNTPIFSIWSAMMYGYFVSFGIPRLGELTRCEALRKKHQIPLATSLSTVVLERVIDMCCLFFVTIVTLYTQLDILKEYLSFEVLPYIQPLLISISNSYVTLGLCFVILTTLALWIVNKLRHLTLIQQIITGFSSVLKLKKPVHFILYTLLIWLSYYLTIPFAIKSFINPNTLGVDAHFSLLSIGSFARSLPIQGGAIGAYHHIISSLLQSVWNIELTKGISIAIVLHGIAVSTQIIFGVLGLGYLSKRKNN